MVFYTRNIVLTLDNPTVVVITDRNDLGDQLRELAVILTQKVKENASIDWTIKESVRAKLKVIVKRTLRQFGYPPDMALLATETVLKQAEIA